MNATKEAVEPALTRIGSDIDLVKVASVIWSRKWLVGAAMLIFGAAAVVYALLATPIYRAEVVVTDARDGSMGAAASLASQFGGLASLAGIDLNGGDATRESRAVLKSRQLVEDFIVRNKIVDKVLPATAQHRSIWRAAEHFRKNIVTIREDNRASTLIVTVDWEDPKVAANWANGFVALANEIVRTRALNDARRNIAYLNEQLKNTSSIEVQKVMFRLIETETKNSMLASGRSEYAFTVVDPAAIPELRVSPKRTLITIGGLLLGFVIGSLIAIAREMSRRTG
jgi:uncharacterized protein involved in exopolysaccharide biosynthesis